jgi:hypothetical protein
LPPLNVTLPELTTPVAGFLYRIEQRLERNVPAGFLCAPRAAITG